MFDKSIIETDSFLNISMSAKALYFLLGMECDDEGFVSPTRVLRLYGGEVGDIKNLMDVGLVIRFNTGVLVITDWHQNNYLDKKRIKPTQYQIEKKQLQLTEQGKYVFNQCLTDVQREQYSIEEKRVEESSTVSEQSSHVRSVPKHNPLGAEIIKAFETVDPKNKKYYNNKTQRDACDFLIEQYGLDEVLKVIDILPQTNGMEFVPIITTPLQLRDKWVQLGTALKRTKVKKQPEVIIMNNNYDKNKSRF